jgi:tRNA pseudouridine38-40 synthase
MNNYKLIIQYKGTNYAGWQFQENSVTVQGKITGAIKIILNEEVNLIGSGRTDAGVHAFGQVANFRCGQEIDVYKVKYSLNSVLPKDISILSLEKVGENFHSRFDALKRSYIYLIIKYKSPFYSPYSYFYHNKADCNYLNNISKVLTGEHDFTSFCRKDPEPENKTCKVSSIHWKETKGFLLFYIEANRFLHGMVRTIAGTLLDAQKNKRDEKYLIEILNARKREASGEALPAKGLFLYKVKY